MCISVSFNALPKLVPVIPLSYGAAYLLKVSVQFTYDRYIVNPRGSIKKSNTSGFNDITRVANDSTIREQELRAFIEDNRVEGGYSDEQLSIIGNGGFIETVIDEPTANPAKKVLERYPTSGAQKSTPAASNLPTANPTSAQLGRLAETVTNIPSGDRLPKGSFSISKPKTKHFGQALHDLFFK